MESTSVTRKYDTASDLAWVIGKLDALQARADKKGLDGSLTYDWTAIPETEDSLAKWVLELQFTGNFALGDYAPVAVIDFTAIETGLVLTIDDTVEIGEDLDPTRCDHCGRHRNRNKVVVVTDGTDLIHVGGTCAQDFLGRNPEWLTWLGEAIDGTPGEPKEYPTEMVIRAAIEACRIGYRKADSEFGTPTKNIVHAMLTGRFYDARDYEYDRKLLAEAPAATQTVAEVIDWMLNESGGGDFAANMRRLAKSPTIGARGIGIAAYAPAGADAWRDKMVATAAKRAAEEARKAEAAPVPVTDKRIRIEGVITTVRNVDSEWGITTKVRVETDEGWACWGTLPKGCEAGSPWNEDGSWKDDDEVEAEAGRGDRIAFMARIEVSADDDKFGFFTRPTKGEIVARGEAEVAA